MTRTSLLALAALAILAPAAHAQSLTLNSGDVVTVSGAGTIGTIGGTPVNNSTTTYGTDHPNRAVTTNGTAIFTLGTGGTISGYGYGLTVNGNGPIAVTGGTVSASVYTLYDAGSSPVTISGGTFTAGYFGYTVNTNSASSSVAITGGSFAVLSGGYDLLNQSGSIDLYGIFDGLALGQTQTLLSGGTTGSFTGTLENNTVPQTFTYSNSGTITLHDVALAAAPEPSQFVAFAVGLLGLSALALKARKRHLA